MLYKNVTASTIELRAHKYLPPNELVELSKEEIKNSYMLQQYVRNEWLVTSKEDEQRAFIVPPPLPKLPYNPVDYMAKEPLPLDSQGEADYGIEQHRQYINPKIDFGNPELAANEPIVHAGETTGRHGTGKAVISNPMDIPHHPEDLPENKAKKAREAAEAKELKKHTPRNSSGKFVKKTEYGNIDILPGPTEGEIAYGDKRS